MADQEQNFRNDIEANRDNHELTGAEMSVFPGNPEAIGDTNVNRNYQEETAPEIDATPDYKEAAEITEANRDYREETAAEIATPVTLDTRFNREEVETGGRGLGFTALALSILSLFVLPILFGAAGIIIGFVARRRGASATGNWAIGIGAVSIIVSIFILPFF